MSDAHQSVSRDGVTVTKSLDRDQFKTPAVVFDLESDRDTRVAIAVSDWVPETVPVDDIGFHPEYGGEHWSIDDHRVMFEHRLDAGEEYTTVYGIRDVENRELEAVIDQEIELEVVTPADTEDGLEGVDDLLSGNEDVVRDVLSGDRDSVTAGDEAPGEATEAADAAAAEPSDAAVPDEPPPPDDAPGKVESQATGEVGASEEALGDDPLASEESGADLEDEPDLGGTTDDVELAADTPEAPDEAGVTANDATLDAESDEPALSEGASIAPGSVASALAAELESGDVDPAERERLREALALTSQPDEEPQIPGHVEARIEHLQSEVSDLAAYTEAMESFLDAYASGESFLDDIQADLDATTERVESLESTLSELDADVDGIANDVAGVSEDVSTLEERLDSSEEELAAVDDRLEAVEDATATVTEVQDDLEDLNVDVDELETELRDDLSDLRSTVEEQAADPERLDDVESTAGSLADDLEAVREELAELQSFRDQLSSAFGPGEES